MGFLLNGIGGWVPTGCQLKPLGNETERYTCKCNHTTSFSILMSPFSLEKDKAIILGYITYIGVGISMASLVLCIIIEIIIWKSVTQNDTSYMRHVSIINVAVSLLIADICFIIGAAVVKKGVGPCSTATFFMHFFYFALFFWMLLSALLLLYRTLMVFSRTSRGTMMAIAFTVGYGTPLIIAVVTVASTAGSKGYIQKDYNCWLNWNKTKALLAFVIPALTIVAINLLVLIMVLCKMLRRGVNASIQPDEKHRLVVIARCVGILTPLFGLTWGFGTGTMVSSNFGIHVVFAFLNSVVFKVPPGEDLTSTQLQELRELKDQFKEVLSAEPGWTHLLHHDIKTLAGRVIQQQLYQVPETHHQAIEAKVARMLQEGIIEESTSPWSNPTVVIPKPDGNLQLCNDFWRLNKMLEFNSYSSIYTCSISCATRCRTSKSS
ncbi:adhesion G-protein coupled receptor F1-like [Neoarius graeffei]|uniref:adhesion G-protein coupled receptor F1-like n=1 Tax=Neoarius graeffei TaxID=443677 RepID=UPI00298C816C|nr:adhesion G-protein coupled receptor F1-like [Neoarius graeffei]XP_060764585.1 adhesion G-protein coupled receptor F1-like [Neoarius graeffei]